MKETTERMLYRMKCKYHVASIDGCSIQSRDGWHFIMDCDGDCRRIKNYDKKVKEK